MAVVDRTSVEALMKLGLNEYEAKVYLALAALKVAGAGRIHDVSGVPRPRVYEVLEELAKKGLVETQQGRPVLFSARAPSEAVKRLVNTYMKTGEEVIRHLKRIEGTERVEAAEALAWAIKGERQIANKLREIVDSAKKDICCYGIPDKLFFLKEHMKKALARGVRVRCITFEEQPKALDHMEDIVQFRNPFIGPKLDEGDYAKSFFQVMREVFIEGSREGPEKHSPVAAMMIVDGTQSFIVQTWDIGLWIKVPVITRTQRLVFEEIWKNAHPVQFEAVKAPLQG